MMDACKESAYQAAESGIALYDACIGQKKISRFLIRTICPIAIAACEKTWDLWKSIEDGYLDAYTGDIAAICKMLQRLEKQNRLDEEYIDSAGNKLSGRYFWYELYDRSQLIKNTLEKK